MKKYEVAKVVFASVITILLALSLTFQVLDARPKKFRYKILFIPELVGETGLDALSDQGWHVVSARRCQDPENDDWGMEYTIKRSY
jgi:hypothetical protein